MEDESEMMPMEGGSPDQYGMEDGDFQDMGGMEGEYGEEGQYMEGDMGDSQFVDQYGQEQPEYGMEDNMDDEGEDDSQNLEKDPRYAHLPALDKMRKVRREVLKTINDYRKHAGVPAIYTDIFTNHAANEYAKFLLDEEPDEDSLKKICEIHRVVGEQDSVVGFSYLDDDRTSTDPTKMAEFMDAHGLLLEMSETMNKLLAKEVTHIGIGFAASPQMVKIVELISTRSLLINRLNQEEDGSILVEGVVLLPEKTGIYAARICSSTNAKKDFGLIGPPGIQYDKSSHKFTIRFPQPEEEVFYCPEPKILEIYVRESQIDKIQYGVPSNEKIKVEHLKLKLRAPMEYIPDPRIEIEDKADMEKFERDMKERAEKAEEERLIKLAQDAAKKEEKEKKRRAMLEAKDKSNGSSDGEGDSDDGEGESDSQDSKGGSRSGASGTGKGSSHKKGSRSGSQGVSGSKTMKSGASMESAEDDDFPDEDLDEEAYDEGMDQIDQSQMKRELIIAIQDMRREYESLKKSNEECQRKIILMDSNKSDYDNKRSDTMLHEHKYLNTLANVHQVRFNLKETQNRYNRMAAELQNKLNDKQQKCTEIDQQFKELKRSVAMNAIYSRTGKKLPPKMIKEWEEAEEAKDQEVHQYRLQNIALRNRLKNQEKLLKKKEMLADGLHIIDYEQLKIENQTLNEKIEERNEELNRLRLKIFQTVITLSHTREKYQYYVNQNAKKEDQLSEQTSELIKVKEKLSKMKTQRDEIEKENQKLKQKTGIVSQKSLKTEFDARADEYKRLVAENEKLAAQHQDLMTLIQQARMAEQKMQYEM